MNQLIHFRVWQVESENVFPDSGPEDLTPRFRFAPSLCVDSKGLKTSINPKDKQVGEEIAKERG